MGVNGALEDDEVSAEACVKNVWMDIHYKRMKAPVRVKERDEVSYLSRQNANRGTSTSLRI